MLRDHERVDLNLVFLDEVVVLAAVPLRQYAEELIHEDRDLGLHKRNIVVVDHDKHDIQHSVR